MQKSLVERIFPKSKGLRLPQYEDEHALSGTSSPHSSAHSRSIAYNDRRPSSQTSGSSAARSLERAPLSYHDDPFLGVDRATKALQDTLQALLDFQSQVLGGRRSANPDDVLSHSSTTPTPSASGAVPIRQPKKRKPTLAGTRRGITRSLQDFARLKDEEIRITENEIGTREEALQQVQAMNEKKDAVEHEMENLEHRRLENGSDTLRAEVGVVETEIRELEDRLMELKAKRRHLISRAEQIENAHASEKSSFRGTLAMIDRDTKSFLAHPPVPGPLNNQSNHERTDMYLLRPERRTLAMATEQWSGESTDLHTRKSSALREQEALKAGLVLWQDVLSHVNSFERQLREYTRSMASLGSSQSRTVEPFNRSGLHTREELTSTVVNELNTTVKFLQRALADAEVENWNILICAIGAELETFQHARTLLQPDTVDPFGEPYGSGTLHANELEHVRTEADSNHQPSVDLLQDGSSGVGDEGHDQEVNGHPSPASSNDSLKQTLKDLAVEGSSVSNQPRQMDALDTGLSGSRSQPLESSWSRKNPPLISESEDDEPDPGFFLSL